MLNRIKHHIFSAAGGALFTIACIYATKDNGWGIAGLGGIILFIFGVAGNGEGKD